MIIKVPKSTKVGIGGALSFIDNLKKALKPFGDEIVEEGNYDILFIAGASLCEREDVEKAVAEGKPILLRVDNILEDSKNRNTGMPRMIEFAEKADVIIYQSEWAKRLLRPYCGEGIVIHNGIDTDIFYPRKGEKTWKNIRVYFSKFSRNEVKRFHEVQYFWREYCLDKKGDTLVLAGRFADDLRKINHPFEFHNEEDYEYEGVIDNPEISAEIIRNCDVAFIPYFADACSNTVLEIQACGVPVLYCPYGGTKEIVDNGVQIDWNKKPVEMVEDVMKMDCFSNLKLWQEEWGLYSMGEKYHGLFDITLNTKKDV